MRYSIVYCIKLLVLWLLFLLPFAIPVQAGEAFKYRVWFADKPAGEYSTALPEAYLSAASIVRRARQGMTVDTTDFPVSQDYIEAVVACGARQVVTSRWLNTLVVAVDDTAVVDVIRRLPFVTKVECVWRSNTSLGSLSKRKLMIDSEIMPEEEYADSYTQISMLNIDSLHAAGFRGEGIDIAVIDLGFTTLMPIQPSTWIILSEHTTLCMAHSHTMLGNMARKCCRVCSLTCQGAI